MNRSTVITFLAGLFSLKIFGANPPNFIIIFMDDMGYADMGVNGAEYIESPNLDRMAAEGVRFTDFYAASNVCTPSRAALLTGSYPKRTGMNSVIFQDNANGLNPNEITIADVLKRKSYATAMVGKWHLGDDLKYMPLAHGFDSYFGIPYSNDMTFSNKIPVADTVKAGQGYTVEQIKNKTGLDTKNHVPLVRDNFIIEYPVDQRYVTRRYTDESIEFIRKNAGEHRPFFLYLAHTMPHIPLFVSDGFATNPSCPSGELYGCGKYADVIEEVDYHIGRLLDSLKTFGIDSSTLVIFTSDNGPWYGVGAGNMGSAFPLRGAKFSTWEGGCREPTLMRWPGTIPKGIVQPGIASTIDVLPTIAAIAGIALPLGTVIQGIPYAIDGTNILNMMTSSGSVSRSTPFFYQQGNGEPIEGVRIGKWKLLNGKLYNLEQDIHEDTDVSSSNAAIKDSLTNILQSFRDKINNEKRPIGTPTTPEPPEGCTNPDAENWSETAMRDDGSCVIVRGCTDPAAGNYNENAVQDDGSCSYSSAKVINYALKKNFIQIHNNSGNITIVLAMPAGAEIRNATGKTLHKFGAAATRHMLVKNTIQPGVYFLYIKMEGTTLVEKFMVY